MARAGPLAGFTTVLLAPVLYFTGLGFSGVLGAVTVIIAINGLALMWGDGQFIFGRRARQNKIANDAIQLEHGTSPLVKALMAAVPTGPVIGDGYRETPDRKMRFLQWAYLGFYLRAAQAANNGLPSTHSLQEIRRRGMENVTLVDIGEIPALIGDDIANATHQLEQAAQERNSNRNRNYHHDVVLAIHTDLGEDARKAIEQLRSQYRGFIGIVRVGEDDSLKDGAQYSENKILARALTESEQGALPSVRALLAPQAAYDEGAFQSYSRIPSQYTADGNLRREWLLWANLGLGWAQVPVEHVIKGAAIADENA